MKKIILALPAILVFLILGFGHVAWAESESGYYDSSQLSEGDLLAPEEVDDLVAPIALYPDPLIAQILPAATFVDQIDEAARYVRQYGRSARIDDQPWDVSVKAVAHYPEVLFMMDQKLDWTVALGQAFIDQPQDVMDAIQTLRAEARAQGNLYSTPQQQVIYEDDVIRIVPATPEYVYVPVYDPQVIYVERYNPAYPLITFGVGFTIGAWLSRDCDWRERRVYYHGWHGSGWISRARPHIHDRRGIYINSRAAAIDVNNRVLQHDTRRFRQQLRTDTIRRREQRGLSVPPARFNHPRPGRTDQPRPGRIEQPRPGRIEQPRPGRPDQQRGPRSGDMRAPAAGQAPAATSPQPSATGQQRRSPATGQPPAATGQQRQPPSGPNPATSGQHRPATGQQPPAATVQPALQQPSPATLQQSPATPTQQSAPGAMRHRQPVPVTGRRPEAPASGDVSRGRDVQKEQPASRSGYGGYGTGADATSYHQRGQSSRENMRQIKSPTPGPKAAPAPTVAPVPRQAAPASRPAVAPAARPVSPAAPAPARQMMQHPPSGRGQPATRPANPPAARPAAPAREIQQR